MEGVLEHVPRKVTDHTNGILCATYMAEEVKSAMFHMFF